MLELDGKALLKHSEKWGPSARTCVNLERGYWETEWYASKTQEAATMFVKTYNRTQELNAVDGLHILCSIRPHHHWDLAGRTMMTATVATKHFYQLITEAAAAANAHQRFQFYHMISHHPSFKTILPGYIFKQFLHTWLICKVASQEVHYCSHGHSSLMSNIFHAFKSFVIPQCQSVEIAGELSSLEKVEQHKMPLAWIPADQGLATVDAIVFTDTHIITLQATITSTYDTKPESFNVIKEKLPKRFKRKRSWHHVIITDNEDKAQHLRSQNLQGLVEKKISIHSTVLNISELQITSAEVRNMEEAKVACLFKLQKP